jgi:ElaB/YqjD/DUF883 family membrane-anchored ribosome-binding protein
VAKLNLGRIAKRAAEQKRVGEAAPANPAPSAAVQKLPEGGDELSKLRGILFGKALEEHELTLARIENRMAVHTAEVQKDLDALARRLEGRIAELGERADREQGELKAQLQTRSEELRRKVVERCEHTRDHVNRGLVEIRTTKLDRTRLTGLLRDVGTRIDADAEPAGGEAR